MRYRQGKPGPPFPVLIMSEKSRLGREQIYHRSRGALACPNGRSAPQDEVNTVVLTT